MFNVALWKLKQAGTLGFYILAIVGANVLMFVEGSEPLHWLSWGIVFVALLWPVIIIIKELKGQL